MKKNKGWISYCLILLIVLVVVQIIAFVIPFQRTACFWIGYGFTMAAVMITFGASFYAFRGGSLHSKFYGISLIYLSWLYIIAQSICGLIFMTASMIPYQVALVVCVLLTASYLIGLIATDAGKDYIEGIDQQVREKTFFIRSLQMDMQEIMSSISEPDLKKAAGELADEIRYSDPVSMAQLSSVEEKIADGLEDLKRLAECDDTQTVLAKIEDIHRLLSQRNSKMKLLK